MRKLLQNRDFVSKLQQAICVEEATVLCSHHLMGLIKNGRVKQKIKDCGLAAAENKKVLLELLGEEATDAEACEESKCEFCNLKTDSFSLVGSLRLGIEITSAAIRQYKSLVKLSDDRNIRELFNGLVKTKVYQRNLFRKEQKFGHVENKGGDFVKIYCIPHVITKL